MNNQNLMRDCLSHLNTTGFIGRIQASIQHASIARHVGLLDPLDLVVATDDNTMPVDIAIGVTESAVQALLDADATITRVTSHAIAVVASCFEESLVLGCLDSYAKTKNVGDVRSLLDDAYGIGYHAHILDHVAWAKLVSSGAFTKEFLPNPEMISDGIEHGTLTKVGDFRFGKNSPAPVYTDAFRPSPLRTAVLSTWTQIITFPAFYKVIPDEEHHLDLTYDDERNLFMLNFKYKFAMDLPDETTCDVVKIVIS